MFTWASLGRCGGKRAVVELAAGERDTEGRDVTAEQTRFTRSTCRLRSSGSPCYYRITPLPRSRTACAFSPTASCAPPKSLRLHLNLKMKGKEKSQFQYHHPHLTFSQKHMTNKPDLRSLARGQMSSSPSAGALAWTWGRGRRSALKVACAWAMSEEEEEAVGRGDACSSTPTRLTPTTLVSIVAWRIPWNWWPRSKVGLLVWLVSNQWTRVGMS